jgi:hypothetical protein
MQNRFLSSTFFFSDNCFFDSDRSLCFLILINILRSLIDHSLKNCARKKRKKTLNRQKDLNSIKVSNTWCFYNNSCKSFYLSLRHVLLFSIYLFFFLCSRAQVLRMFIVVVVVVVHRNDNGSYASTIAVFSRSLINSNIIRKRERERKRQTRDDDDDDDREWKRKIVSRIYSYMFYLFSLRSVINDFN